MDASSRPRSPWSGSLLRFEPASCTPDLASAQGAPVERFGPADPGRRPSLVVAVPVRDEVERIGLCLDSLAAQEGVDFAEMAVVLLLNNTTDGTAAEVRRLAPLAPYVTWCIQVT